MFNEGIFKKAAAVPAAFQMAAVSALSLQYTLQNFHYLFWPSCFSSENIKMG